MFHDFQFFRLMCTTMLESYRWYGFFMLRHKLKAFRVLNMCICYEHTASMLALYNGGGKSIDLSTSVLLLPRLLIRVIWLSWCIHQCRKCYMSIDNDIQSKWSGILCSNWNKQGDKTILVYIESSTLIISDFDWILPVTWFPTNVKAFT